MRIVSPSNRITTTAIVLHQNDHGETLSSSKLPGFYQHRMPDADMNLVAEMKNLDTGESTEYRYYRGSIYRPDPERAKEASGGCVYLRLPDDQAKDVVENFTRRISTLDSETLAYQGAVWVKTQMPGYKVIVSEASVDVIGASEPPAPYLFNAMQGEDAVRHALKIGEQQGLPIHQTHKIIVTEQSLVGPAAATGQSSALRNTVNQQLDPIVAAAQQMKNASTDKELALQLRSLAQLVACLDRDAQSLLVS